MNQIVHNAEANRYELYCEGELASLAEYRRAGSRMIFDHTETRPQFQGRGLAAEVVEYAMKDVRERELTVVPQCWFVRQFIDEHPEYGDLLDTAA